MVNVPDDDLRIFGGQLGGGDKKQTAAARHINMMNGTRAQLGCLDDAAVELRIARSCLGAS
eukprot:89384-Lingulodinium_polyedra.AAC.1